MQLLAGSAEAAADDRLAALAENLLSSERDDIDNVWTEACANGNREEELHATVARLQAAEADQLAEILDAGKASGVIDSSLSTAALVFVCQSLGIGAQMVLRCHGADQALPTDSDLAEVIAKLIAAIAPAS